MMYNKEKIVREPLLPGHSFQEARVKTKRFVRGRLTVRYPCDTAPLQGTMGRCETILSKMRKETTYER